jgi:drug/metabolite transporter (DMT)-like permease
MTGLAFGLVLASAVCHATWNLLLKQSTHKVAFMWSLSAVSFVAFLIPGAVVLLSEGMGWTGLAFGCVTAVLHGAYGLALARGYQMGDLSLVYPIARGMGTALVPLAAVTFLSESISWFGAIGIALVITGVVVLQLQSIHPRKLLQPLSNMAAPATGIAIVTGAFITLYSLWDKASLDHLAPMTVNQFSMIGYVVLLPPLVLREGAASLVAEWRARWPSIVAAGLLAPFGYMLVLIALQTSQVSYVAPAREVGILLGALLGVTLLGEGYGRIRIAGSALIVAGVLTLGILA